MKQTGKPEVAANPAVADHRRAARAGRSINKLTFPFSEKPAPGTVIELTEGIFWSRIPLPWALDHINVYIVDDGDGWAVIDTGVQGARGREAWETLFEGPLKGRPITRVIATHMHPDHLGLAGWLVERFGASFAMTLGEYMTAQVLWLGASDTVPETELNFLWRAGVDRQMEPIIQATGFSGFKKGVSQLPGAYQRLEDGKPIELGGRTFTTVIGRGHSPEHACLFSPDANILMAGDQVLPGITSNVSVFAREPEANPLAHWISSLSRLSGLLDYSNAPGKLMVLPSHGKVFQGLKIRLEDLIAGHSEKLQTLAEHTREPKTVVECFPALFSREVTGFEFFMALGEAVAHLNLLRALGVVDRDSSGEVDRYQTCGDFDPASVVEACNALPGVELRALEDVLGPA